MECLTILKNQIYRWVGASGFMAVVVVVVNEGVWMADIGVSIMKVTSYSIWRAIG